MLNGVWLMLMLAAMSQAMPHHDPAQVENREAAPKVTAASTSMDYGQVKSLLNSYAKDMTVAPIASVPSVTLGVSVPESLRKEIYTAVPPSILVQLMNSKYRASVASDFQAGTTPKWYKDLNPDLKTFFEGMASQIRTGDAVVTRTSAPDVSETDEGESGDGSDGEAKETSTSEDAAKPTGVDQSLLASAVGMAGILGLALAL